MIDSEEFVASKDSLKMGKYFMRSNGESCTNEIVLELAWKDELGKEGNRNKDTWEKANRSIVANEKS